MKAKKQLTFEFAKTEEEAIGMTARANASLSVHYRKHHPALYTPWSSGDGKENLFIVWTWR